MVSCIFEYDDYRKFLSDWFLEKKKASKSFSYASFAEKAGFSDRGFINNVIHRRRDLTKESLVKVAEAIGLSKDETDYFENLVFFNKSIDLKERNYFFEKMCQVKSTGKEALKAIKMRDEQYEFYSKWHHSAIRSLIDMYPFSNDYEWLAKNVSPQITVREAKKSVELLERLGMIYRQDNGRYKLATKTITTGSEIKSLGVQNFHRMAADQAKRALEILPVSKRNITGLTIGISDKTYHRICEEIQAFRSKVINFAENDECADRTYQLNFHLFPVTRTDIKNKGDK
jgi:uncharacterized protein (TIGR02147 family)